MVGRFRREYWSNWKSYPELTFEAETRSVIQSLKKQGFIPVQRHATSHNWDLPEKWSSYPNVEDESDHHGWSRLMYLAQGCDIHQRPFTNQETTEYAEYEIIARQASVDYMSLCNVDRHLFKTPLSLAVENDNFIMVDILLQHGAGGYHLFKEDTNSPFISCVQYAYKKSNKEIVNKFIQHGYSDPAWPPLQILEQHVKQCPELQCMTSCKYDTTDSLLAFSLNMHDLKGPNSSESTKNTLDHCHRLTKVQPDSTSNSKSTSSTVIKLKWIEKYKNDVCEYFLRCKAQSEIEKDALVDVVLPFNIEKLRANTDSSNSKIMEAHFKLSALQSNLSSTNDTIDDKKQYLDLYLHNNTQSQLRLLNIQAGPSSIGGDYWAVGEDSKTGKVGHFPLSCVRVPALQLEQSRISGGKSTQNLMNNKSELQVSEDESDSDQVQHLISLLTSADCLSQSNSESKRLISTDTVEPEQRCDAEQSDNLLYQ